MSSRGPCRRHSTPFKLLLYQDIRSGMIGRHDAQRSHNISTNLIQLWLTQFDPGALTDEETEANLPDRNTAPAFQSATTEAIIAISEPREQSGCACERTGRAQSGGKGFVRLFWQVPSKISADDHAIISAA